MFWRCRICIRFDVETLKTQPESQDLFWILRKIQIQIPSFSPWKFMEPAELSAETFLAKALELADDFQVVCPSQPLGESSSLGTSRGHIRRLGFLASSLQSKLELKILEPSQQITEILQFVDWTWIWRHCIFGGVRMGWTSHSLVIFGHLLHSFEAIFTM